MISTSNETPLVAVSVSIYRFLLAAYPAKFRQEYGEDMVQLFRDCSLRAVRQSGSEGMVRVWAVTFLDLIQSLFKEHLQKETNMSKSTFIRISGWALVLAGIIFVMIFTAWYLDEANPLLHIMNSAYLPFAYFSGFYAGPLLLAIGMLGLRARYSETVGAAGSSMLIFGAFAGPAISLIGILGTPANDSLWVYHIFGPSASMFFLAIFGIQALSSKPLSRGNALPIFAGSVLPILSILGFGLGTISRFHIVTLGLLTLQFLSMVLLGILLQGDASHNEFLATA